MIEKHPFLRLLLGSLFAVGLIPVFACAATINLSANDSLTASGNWSNVPYSYADDGSYTTGRTINRYFTVGLEDPTDTVNMGIASVVVYAKGYSSYSKGKIRLTVTKGGFDTISATSNFGVTELVQAFNVTNFRPPWRWSDIVNLNVTFELRDNKGNYYVNHIYAVVTYDDTSAATSKHYFAFNAIVSPETLGVQFPVVARVMMPALPVDTLMSTYNNNVNFTDYTGTVTPNVITFTAGVCSTQVMIAKDTTATALTVTDGDTSGTSNSFAVINPGLHHFGFDSIGSQTVLVPFPIIASALDFYGDTVTSWTGMVDLWDDTGTLTPDSSGLFSGGMWGGSVTVAATFTGDVVYCSQTSGGKTYTGASNGFDLAVGVSGSPETAADINGLKLAAYPNPARRELGLDVISPAAGKLVITLYNILGQVECRKDAGMIQAGIARVNIPLSANTGPGVYFVEALVGERLRQLQRVIIIK